MLIPFFPKSWQPEATAITEYLRSGMIFGEMVSYGYLGKAFGFEKRLEHWGSWEKDYSRRGFRTISLDDFIESSCHTDISKLVKIKRKPHEKPVLHAVIYRECLLDKTEPANITIDKKTGIFFGTYRPPSTSQYTEPQP